MSAFEKPPRKIDTFLSKADKHLQKLRSGVAQAPETRTTKIKDALNVIKQNFTMDKTD